MDELEVRVAQPLHLTVVVEVLAIDVGHHRDDGREEEEGAVALVRLGDQELALPQARVGAERAHLAADDHGRVAPRLAQHRGGERGGGGLPVAAADRHAVLHAHQLGQDRKSTRLNSSHMSISYAVFCLKKKKKKNKKQ